MKQKNEIRRVRVPLPRGWKVSLGQSVMIDGICTTVVARAKGFFEVELMPETLAKTTAGTFARDTLVNLERSLTLSAALDGHIVLGHVDATARLLKRKDAGGSRTLTFALPAALAKFVAPIGSIAVNGVSLTVARVSKTSFEVALIPFTLAHTNLGSLKEGDEVNLEADVLARYAVAALFHGGTVPLNAAKGIRKKARRA